MRPVHRTRLAMLLALALVTPAAANDSGEIWITGAEHEQLKILSGNGQIETVPLPAEAQPHTITFSPDGSYAYVSKLGDGNLLVVRTEDRQIVTTINLGPNCTHHTQPSADGSVLLSANPMTGMLTKIAADEEAENWTPVASDQLSSVMRSDVPGVLLAATALVGHDRAPLGVPLLRCDSMSLAGEKVSAFAHEPSNAPRKPPVL